MTIGIIYDNIICVKDDFLEWNVRANKQNFVSENDIMYCISIGVIFHIYSFIQINIRIL